MERKKALKVAGFTGAVCASVALVTAGVSATGAYFTDSHNGAINASTGGVHLNTTDTSLNFANLLPGEFQTKQIDYQATGTGSEDVWLVLPADGSADALTDDGNGDGLGRYGHFAVSAPAGTFSSYNLRQGSGGCGIDANGHGGSNQQASSTNNADPDSYVPYCAAPHAILLSSGLSSGQGGTVSITFGFTKVLKSGADAPSAQIAKFQIVATQHGVRPDDVNNPS